MASTKTEKSDKSLIQRGSQARSSKRAVSPKFPARLLTPGAGHLPKSSAHPHARRLTRFAHRPWQTPAAHSIPADASRILCCYCTPYRGCRTADAHKNGRNKLASNNTSCANASKAHRHICKVAATVPAFRRHPAKTRLTNLPVDCSSVACKRLDISQVQRTAWWEPLPPGPATSLSANASAAATHGPSFAQGELARWLVLFEDSTGHPPLPARSLHQNPQAAPTRDCVSQSQIQELSTSCPPPQSGSFQPAWASPCSPQEPRMAIQYLLHVRQLRGPAGEGSIGLRAIRNQIAVYALSHRPPTHTKTKTTAQPRIPARACCDARRRSLKLPYLRAHPHTTCISS